MVSGTLSVSARIMSYKQQPEQCLNTCSKLKRGRNKSACALGSVEAPVSALRRRAGLLCFFSAEEDRRNGPRVHTLLNTNHSWPSCGRQMPAKGVCASLLKPNKALKMTIYLDHNNQNRIILQERVEEEFHHCSKFKDRNQHYLSCFFCLSCYLVFTV